MIKPLGKRVILKRDEQVKETTSGIVLTTSSEIQLYGTILAVSDEVTNIKPGDKILIPGGGSVKFVYDGDALEMYTVDALLGIVS